MYSVRLYEGDYRERQQQANVDGCAAYVEHHFNSSQSPSANYCVVITGVNASQTSRNWGRWYAQAVGREFWGACPNRTPGDILKRALR